MLEQVSAYLKRRRWKRATDEEIAELVAAWGGRKAAAFYGVTQPTVSRRLNPPRKRARTPVLRSQVRLPQAQQQEISFRPFLLEQAHVEEAGRRIAEMDGLDPAETIAGLAQSLCRQGSLWYDALDSEGKTVGMVGLESIQIDHGAIAHARFYDRRVRGREVAVGRFLAEFAGKLGLHVVWSFTPVKHRSTPFFLKRMGFGIHGVMPRFFRTQRGLEDAVFASVSRETLAERYGGASCQTVAQQQWRNLPLCSEASSPAAEALPEGSSGESRATDKKPHRSPQSSPCSKSKPSTGLRLVSSSAG